MLEDNGTLFAIMGFEGGGASCMKDFDIHLDPADASLGLRLAANHLFGHPVQTLSRHVMYLRR